MKKFLIQIINYFTTIKYEIGFIDSSITRGKNQTLSNQIHWMHDATKEKKSWFADPFILSYEDNRIQVLAEEFLYESLKGRITLLNIEHKNDEYVLINKRPLLEIHTHLSFPYIIQEQDDIYICPENYQSGGVAIYKYAPETQSVEFINQIIDDPLVDTQLIKHGNTYYAMGVRTITGDLTETKELRVYRSNELCGKYKHFQTIKNTLMEERGAGQIWAENEYYVRPAQSCEGGYGRMLIMYRLDFNNGYIQEQEINRFRPDICKKNGMSLHTFNTKNHLCVVDGHDYKNIPFISRIVAPCINFVLSCVRH